jgi:hypothetical protein
MQWAPDRDFGIYGVELQGVPQLHSIIPELSSILF